MFAALAKLQRATVLVVVPLVVLRGDLAARTSASMDVVTCVLDDPANVASAFKPCSSGKVVLLSPEMYHKVSSATVRTQ